MHPCARACAHQTPSEVIWRPRGRGHRTHVNDPHRHDGIAGRFSHRRSMPRGFLMGVRSGKRRRWFRRLIRRLAMRSPSRPPSHQHQAKRQQGDMDERRRCVHEAERLTDAFEIGWVRANFTRDEQPCQKIEGAIVKQDCDSAPRSIKKAREEKGEYDNKKNKNKGCFKRSWHGSFLAVLGPGRGPAGPCKPATRPLSSPR